MEHRSRPERAEPLGAAAAALATGQPLRQVAAGLGVARSTLRGWRAALPLDGIPPEAVAALSTPEGARLEHALYNELIPALYLQRVAARSSRAETGHQLLALSTTLLEPLRQPSHPLQQLPLATRQQLEALVGDCADLFQRSSSCVEGRNGHLSLYHHGCHRLSDRKLGALTAIHNFHILRPDGTTADERLFGRAHAPLFEQLISRVPLPPQPRRRRTRPPKQPYLTPVAA